MGTKKTLSAVLISTTFCAFALLFSTCGGGREPTLEPGAPDVFIGGKDTPETDLIQQKLETDLIQGESGKSVALADVLKELDALQPPPGVDASLFAQLKSALSSELSTLNAQRSPAEAGSTGRFVSAPPTGVKNQVDDLALMDNGDGTYTLTWTYKNVGDYDHNGTVAIADITPLAEHFQKPADETNNWIDGDSNGIINIADITPIAQNFFHQVAGYSIQFGENAEGPFTEVRRIEYSLPEADELKRFNESFADPVSTYAIVVPYDADSILGESSNVAKKNVPPVPILTADPIEGEIPLTVAFDASASYDPDGEITFYEWNFGRAFTWDVGGVDLAAVEYTFEIVGTYNVKLRITDDAGGKVETSVEINTRVPRGDWWMYGHDPQHTFRSSYVGPSDPVIKWRLDFQEIGFNHTITTPIVIGRSRTLVFGLESGQVCWVTEDGEILRVSVGVGGAITTSPAVGEDGTVYVGDENGLVQAIGLLGETKWTFQGDGRISSHPAIAEDGSIYIGTDNGTLYALDPEGNLKWTFQGDGKVVSSALASDGTVYVTYHTYGDASDSILALTQTGFELWAVEVGAIGNGIAIGPDGTLFTAGGQSLEYVSAYSPAGDLIWQSKLGDFGASYNVPALSSDGSIYIVGITGPQRASVYRFSNDGSLQWFRSYQGLPYEQQPIVDAEGNLYLAGALALDVQGNERWPVSSRLGYAFGAQSIGLNGVVYMASTNEIIAIEQNKQW